jgi:uncharacterized membrane protein YbhN (UPF0104 family)
VARLLLAVLLTFLIAIPVARHEDIQKSISNAVHPPPQGVAWLVTLVWFLGTIGVIVLTVLVTALLHRLEVLRDVAVGAGLALAACFGVQWLFGVTAGFSSDPTFTGVNLGYPIPILAAAAAAALTIRPYLSRGLQRTLEGLILLGVATGLVHGAGLPFSLLASLVLGWGAAAGAHLIFGTPTGVPSAADVTALVGDLGISVTSIVPAKRQVWGSARFEGTAEDGTTFHVSVFGRDALESQLWAKLGRTLFLRKDSGPFSLTREQQLEHEGYLTLLAGSVAPGETSTVVASGFGGVANDAAIVTVPPVGKPLADLVSGGGTIDAAQAKSLVGVVAKLHAARITHGAIDLRSVYLDGDKAGLSGFDRSTAFADDDALHKDTASLIVTLTVAGSVDDALAAAIDGLGKEAVAGSLPFLQDVALPDPLTQGLRKDHNKPVLKELRTKGASLTGVDVPELATLHRVSATSLVLAVGTLIGGWALIDVLLKVADSFNTVKSASIPWVIATAIIGQVAYFGNAASSLGSITLPVPYFPLVALELSNTFSGLALGTPAVLAARVRFFQRHGMDTTVAVSSGVLVSTASWIVKGGLFLISLPFALGALHFGSVTAHKAGSGDKSSMLIYILLIVVGIGVLLGIVLAVPRWRARAKDKLAPRAREVVAHFKVLAGRPAKIVEIFGGQVLAQLVVALALGTALHAYHQSLPLPVLFVVLTLGSVLGGISPVPGGMGVVEAGMILGLKAAGIPDAEAISAVFVQRLFTAYLPPIAGWFSLMWLRRKKYL